jgi:tripartite-type tricarboxylate transporter receptor subunit TctC
VKKRGWIIVSKVMLCAIFLVLLPALSQAQQYPTKPVNVTIGYGPASGMDLCVRAIASATEKNLGQPFVIINSAGGGGSVAYNIVAKQRPDGYHLMGNSTSAALYLPHLRSLPYTLQDFVPVLIFAKTPHKGIVVRSDAPWKNLKEFVDYAKKNPGKITYGHSGVGGSMHIAAEVIAAKEGIKWTGIPYKSTIESCVALLGGHVDMASIGIPENQDHFKAGKLRLLASVEDERYHRLFPDIPTLMELGYNFSAELYVWIAAPKGTPPTVIKTLDEAFRKGMKDPQFVQAMEKLDNKIDYKNSEDTKKYLETAYIRLGQLIKDLNIPKEK